MTVSLRAVIFMIATALLGVASVSAQYTVEVAFPNLTFSRPLAIQHPGDQSNLLFVLEQEGVIRSFENDPSTSTTTTFLDWRGPVTNGGEEGLLGIAFHPNYETNRLFYIYYTRSGPLRNVLSQFSRSETNPDVADPGSEVVMLEISQPTPGHNGGQLAFGSDGYLYIAVGDGGGIGDPNGNGQNRQTLHGSILRIDIDNSSSGKNYAIPADNPYIGNPSGYREEIWAYGLRNPWRFSFDPVTDKLWAADVGQDQWEEIDIVESGKNYGWNVMEGAHCYASPTCDQTGKELPVYEYSHAAGDRSITGGYVYRGSRLPGLIGKYIYADFISGRIWALTDTGSGFSNELLVDTDLRISSFGIDQANELFITAFDGKIYQLKSLAPNTAPVFTSSPVTDATQDQPYLYNITTSDVDGDPLTITGDTVPSWLNLTDNTDGTATLSGFPGDSEVGTHNVVLRVSDGLAATTQSFSIVVANVNDAPFFTSTPVTSGTQNELYLYQVVADDIDEADTLTFSAPTLPSWLTLTDNGNRTATLSGTPANADVGDNPIVLEVTDGSETASQSFVLAVADSNDPPAFTSDPVTVATEDSSYSYLVTASDPDAGDALAFIATTLPQWLQFTDQGGGTALLSGIPANQDVGDHSVVLEVSDGEDSAQQSFLVTVVNTNDAPIFISDPVLIATQDSAYLYAVVTQDVDVGDTLTISLRIAPDWLSLIDAGDGTATLTGTPSTSDVGSHTVEIDVRDLSDAGSTQAFSVEVRATNAAPTAVADSYSVAEGDTLQAGGGSPIAGLLSNDSDPDGDPLSAVSVTSPQNGTLAMGTDGGFTYIHDGSETTSDAFQYRASDGLLVSPAATVTISVVPVNDVPVFISGSPPSRALAEVQFEYVAEVRDDDSIVSFTADTSLPSWITLDDRGDNTALLTGTPSRELIGMVFQFELLASDEEESARLGFVLTVEDANEAPTPPQIVTPEDGVTLAIEGNPLDVITITWTESTDADGDAVSYRWELGAAADLTSPLLQVDADTMRYVDVTMDEASQLLDSQGIAAGESATFYHRVIAMDGLVESPGPINAITLLRGGITANEFDVAPDVLALHQNYPNPFTRETTISFDLPSTMAVEVSVFDLLGRRVDTLIGETLAGGRHTVVFRPEKIPSGLYMYRIQVSNHTESKTMLFLR